MPQVKKRIQKSFSDASATYDCVARLQAKVGGELLRQVNFSYTTGVALDLGCGTGFLSQALLTENCCTAEHIIALDIAPPMLALARAKINQPKVSFLCADAEFLPLQNHSVNLVMSNFALQWCEDLNRSIQEARRVLKSGGLFLFTIFGESTLHELKSAWQQVDSYAHVNTFVHANRLRNMLVESGFQVNRIQTEAYVSVYESVWDLMAELKQLGAQTIIKGGNRQITTKTAMNRMIQAYQKQDKEGLVPATFEVISVSAEIL